MLKNIYVIYRGVFQLVRSYDSRVAEAIGEISQSNKQIAVSLAALQDNLRTMNEQNILHSTNTINNENKILEKLENLTSKYWWLFIALLGVVLLVLGYKEAIKLLAGM